MEETDQERERVRRVCTLAIGEFTYVPLFMVGDNRPLWFMPFKALFTVTGLL